MGNLMIYVNDHKKPSRYLFYSIYFHKLWNFDFDTPVTSTVCITVLLMLIVLHVQYILLILIFLRIIYFLLNLKIIINLLCMGISTLSIGLTLEVRCAQRASWLASAVSWGSWCQCFYILICQYEGSGLSSLFRGSFVLLNKATRKSCKNSLFFQ